MSENERILGLDWGEANIGLAVSDCSLTISQPLECIKFKELEEVISKLKNIEKEYNIVKIVIGCPYSEDGSAGKTADKVKIFVEQLKENLNSSFIFWDERFSTMEVEKIFRGVKFKKKKKNKNSIAAAIILQSYLDSIKSEAKR